MNVFDEGPVQHCFSIIHFYSALYKQDRSNLSLYDKVKEHEVKSLSLY